MKTILKWLLLLPVAAAIIVFSIYNRHAVDVVVDPSGIVFAGMKIALPLYIVVFAAMVIGVIAGGVASWLKQGKHRKAAREARSEARKTQAEAERLRSQVAALPATESSITAAYTGRNAA
ncbi:MAG: LapA family protein [Hyphomicrobiales bacterium]|nr:LapA family protein [Hyphomicrobiales bacterium]